MTDAPQGRDGTAPARVSAADFQAALSSGPDTVGTPAATEPSPAVSAASDTGARERTAAGAAATAGTADVPATDAGTRPLVTAVTPVDAATMEPALDRPGKPALAGAAIAGLLLLVAPFAFAAGTQELSLGSVPVSAGGFLGGNAAGTTSAGDTSAGTGESAAEPSSETAASAAGGASDPAAGGEEAAYVPEALPRESGAAAPPAAEGGGTEVADTAAAEPGGSGAGTAGEADRPDPSEQRADTGTDTAATAADDDGAQAATAGEGTGSEPETGAETGTEAGAGTAAGADEAPDQRTEEAPASEPDADGTAAAEQDTTAGESASTLSERADTGTGDVTADSGADQGGGSVLEDATAGAGGTERAPFSALTGPGCLSSPGAAYDRANRWDSAQGTASWSTRQGGHTQEGCDGGYEAIPVSGSPGHGDGQYAYWSFAPGYPDARCEIYVHVPDDESPLWVADTEAVYQIFSGPVPEGDAIAVFGLVQSQVRGAWVQVTGFTSPTEEFTVQLTNVGEDPLADQEDASAHVAASAVRTSCT
jgi:hypothetical protein